MSGNTQDQSQRLDMIIVSLFLPDIEEQENSRRLEILNADMEKLRP